MRETVTEKESEIRFFKRDREDYMKAHYTLELENKRMQNDIDKKRPGRGEDGDEVYYSSRAMTMPDEISTSNS
jgi:hypothetical protein